MSRFEVHWCDVSPDEAPILTRPSSQLLALWPAPVNADACFEEAGFTDFADNDIDWDREAAALLVRVVQQLTIYGEPRLVSPPLLELLPWHKRLFRQPRPRPLLEQLELSMHWDSLPACHVEFGSAGAAVRTGNGHVLLWVTLPCGRGDEPKTFVREVAAGHSVTRTPLRWRTLLVTD